MDYALAHNTQMKHLQNEQRRREVKAQASKDARLPQFTGDMGGALSAIHYSGNANSTANNLGTADNRFDANGLLLSMGLSGAVPLYTGKRLSSQLKADKYAMMAAVEDVRTAQKNLRIQVAAAYLQVLYNKGEEKIAQQRLEVSQLLLKRARSLFDKGGRPESDVVEATAMVSRDEALLTAAEGETALSELDLKQLLNLPDTVVFAISELTDDALHDSLAIINYPLPAADSHSAVQSANYGILQAAQVVQSARSGYYPTLSLVGQLGTLWANLNTDMRHSGQIHLQQPLENLGAFDYTITDEAEWKRNSFLYGMVGLKLTVPVFNAFQTRARIRTAKASLEDAKLAYDDARQRVRKDLSQAWLMAVTAHKRYKSEVKAEQSGALAYQYALKRYNAGMATLFDLSQSRQQWFTTQENALRMKYEYLIRKRILYIQADLGY